MKTPFARMVFSVGDLPAGILQRLPGGVMGFSR
jgi:hypothetical protein